MLPMDNLSVSYSQYSLFFFSFKCIILQDIISKCFKLSFTTQEAIVPFSTTCIPLQILNSANTNLFMSCFVFFYFFSTRWVILCIITDFLFVSPFENSCLCDWLQGTFDTKDTTASAHAGITQATAYYPYDPTLGQYQYDRYVVSVTMCLLLICKNRNYQSLERVNCKTYV